MLSEVSPMEKAKTSDFTHVKYKTKNKTKTNIDTDNRLVVIRGGGEWGEDEMGKGGQNVRWWMELDYQR